MMAFVIILLSVLVLLSVVNIILTFEQVRTNQAMSLQKSNLPLKH